MQAFSRTVFPYLAIACLITGVLYAFSFEKLEPADFTFVNGTEIKSVDPAIVTGQPEGRIINAIYEGLVNWDPKTLEPVPGVAERWEISEDGRTITFHLREDAHWSDGSPITSEDFLYSNRRFLDPTLAAEYAYQLFYIVGAEEYNTFQFKVGDRVEVELNDPPEGALPYARGELFRGQLVSKETELVEEFLDNDGKPLEVQLFVVNVHGETRRFKTGKKKALARSEFDNYTAAKQVLRNFETVGISAPDKYTVRYQLKNPVPYFVSLTGFYPTFPVHQKSVETHGYPAWTRPENIVSNGAFRLQVRRIRDRIRMVKSPTYWDADNVELKIVDALAVENSTTGLNLYMTGKVDWCPGVPPIVVPIFLREKRPDFHAKPYLVTGFLRFNLSHPTQDVLKDRRIRKALSLAIDRKEIVEKVIEGGETPAYSLVPPNIPGYIAATCEGYNLEKARELLSEAGYPGGKGFPKVTVLYNSGMSSQKIFEYLQFQWRDKLGVEIELSNMEWTSFLAKVHSMEYQIARAGWIADYYDPNTFLDMFVTDGANNETGFSNARYDEILKKLAPQEPNAMKRMELLREAEAILLDEMPIIPLYFGVSKSMIQPYVMGLYSNLQDIHPLKGIKIDNEAKARSEKERNSP